MMKRTNIIRTTIIRALYAGMLCSLVPFSSCSDDGGLPPSGHPEDGQTFVLEYTLPDTQAEANAVTYAASYVPSANEFENRVDKLHLLFFVQDDHGNGTFAGMLEGTLEGGSIEKTGSVTVSLSGGISNSTDYNVLVLANAHKYFSNDSELTTFCQSRTENTVRLLLQAQLPAVDSRHYQIPDNLLLMSGTAVKQAGKDMKVDLLRAAVRIDVKIADGKTDEYELLGATIRNASPRIPLFSSPSDLEFVPLGLNRVVSATDGTLIKGGMYLPETLRTGLDDLALRDKQSACVLVSCKKKSYSGNRTWYRVDLCLGDDGVQYLRRNNAYMVIISNIKGLGVTSPDDAYADDGNLLNSVTIPVEWETPSGVRPPEVDIN